MPNEKHKHPTEGIQQYPGREETIMKNNPFTRFLSVALTAAMLVGVMPGAVLADAGEAIVGASSAVVESIPGSTTPADAAPVATEVPPVTEPEATPETTQEPEATPEATEQPEATPEATQEPEATPEATEQPEATPETTQEPEATPEATEEPEATPEATEEPETVNAQALLDELMALDDQAFLAAVDALTEEQAAALEALGEEALADYAARKQTLQQNAEWDDLFQALLAADSMDAFDALLDGFTDEDIEAFSQYLGEEKVQQLSQKCESLTPQEEEPVSDFVPPVSFTNVAPILQSVQSGMLRNSMSRAALFTAPGSNPATDGYTSETKDEDNDGLAVGKTVTPTEDGYNIQLEVYANGTVTSTASTKPTDIVLVLDVSGSMENCINCGEKHSGLCDIYTYVPTYSIQNSGRYYYQNTAGNYKRAYYCSRCSIWSTQEHSSFWGHRVQGEQLTPKTSADSEGTQFYVVEENNTLRFESRIDALKNAATTFVNNVAKSNVGVDADKQHRIALVKFAGRDNTWKIGNDFYEDGWYTYNYTQTVKSLTTMDAANAAIMNNTINSLEAAGATSADYGMQHANSILTAAGQDSNYDRNQVVVFFTDGEPNHDSGFDSGVANDAIGESKSMKDVGATIYTIGVFSGADGSLPGNENDKTNWYMHLMSSNYLNAESMREPGEVNPALEPGESYYLSAGDSGSLEDIFEKISNEIGNPKIELGTDTIIRDVIDDHFVLDSTQDIKVEKVDKTVDGWSNSREDITNSVKVNPIDQTINVTGIDISGHFVSDKPRTSPDNDSDKSYYGSKYVITIPIKVRDGFYGGNAVTTNTSESGVYRPSETEPVDAFPMPSVDVEIQYNFAVQNQTIYISNDPDYSKLINFLQNQPGNTLYGTAKNNDYVDLVYTVKDEDGDIVGTYTIYAGATTGNWSAAAGYPTDKLTECTPYQISCSVQPIYTGDVKDKELPAQTATVHVLKPVITWQDTTKDYNAVISASNLEDENFVKVEWKDYDIGHSASTALGPVPALTYTFTLENGNPLPATITEELHVKVAVTANTMPLTGDNVKFEWQANNAASTGCTDSCDDPNPGYQFRIHLGTGTLIINKVVSEFANNGKPVFDFKVTSQGADGTVYYFHIDMTGKNGQEKVAEITLPAGQYKVEELNNLNYPLQNVDGDISKNGGTVSVGGNPQEVTFTNKGKNTNIPTDGSAAVNTLNKVDGEYILSFKKEELGADSQTPAGED